MQRKQIEMQADRQTSRQIDSWTNNRWERQTDMQTVVGETNVWMERQQMERTDRQTSMEKDRWIVE